MSTFRNRLSPERRTGNLKNTLFRYGIGISVAAVAAPALAATQWGSYQWSSNPSPLEVRWNVTTTDWENHVKTAAFDWTFSSTSTSFSMSMAATRETGAVSRSTCKGPTGKVEVCNNKYGFNGWLGIAQIWTSGNLIQKASVKLNDSYFNTTTYSSNAWKNLVTCQEIGHTIGLGHDDTNFNDPNYGTCMDYTSNPTASGPNGHDNETPNGNDYGLLECIYAERCSPSGYLNASNPTSTASVPQRGRSHAATDFGIRSVGDPATPDVDPGNSPAEWGKAVAFTHDGRGRVYERVVAPGRKIITEVFWAPQ